jgi:hypothetical protein
VGTPALFEPDLVSTEKSEVKVTFSPDGQRLLWGTIGWSGGAGGWDIWESLTEGDRWGTPHPVPFDSPENDFDPSFSPDGRGVYFFSNRPGGLGGDDVYFVPIDASGVYGRPTNLGANVNSKGDEWGPVVSSDGTRLLVSTDGRGGQGRHDLFVSRRDGDHWAALESLGAEVSTSREEFDAAFLDHAGTIVFASGDLEHGPVALHVSFSTAAGHSKPIAVPSALTSPSFMNFGCATNPREPGVLYFTSNFAGNAKGRSDIYRVPAAPLADSDATRNATGVAREAEGGHGDRGTAARRRATNGGSTRLNAGPASRRCRRGRSARPSRARSIEAGRRASCPTQVVPVSAPIPPDARPTKAQQRMRPATTGPRVTRWSRSRRVDAAIMEPLTARARLSRSTATSRPWTCFPDNGTKRI